MNLFGPLIALNALVISTHEPGYKLGNQSTKLSDKVENVRYS